MIKKIFCLLLLAMTPLVFAVEEGEEEEARKWTNETDLSAVWTDGNSESGSFGLGNAYTYAMDKGSFAWNVDVNRVETTTVTLSAIGSATDPVFRETRTTDVTTESYETDLTLNREFGERTSWYVKLDWERNEPSGFRSRLTPELGITNNWISEDTKTFSTSYGFAYTSEDPLVGEDDNYSSATLGYDFSIKFGNSEFKQGFDANINVEETSAWRWELDNSLSVNMTDKLALAVSLDFDYDNEPHFDEVTIADGSDAGQVVLYEKEKLDSTFNASLVIKF